VGQGTPQTPLVDGDIVYVTVGRTVVAYDLTALDAGPLWNWSATTALSAPPAMDARTLYVGTKDGTLTALQKADGTKRWQQTIGNGAVTPPTIDTDRSLLVAGCEHQLAAYNTGNGKTAATWQCNRNRRFNSKPAVQDGRIYAIAVSARAQAQNPQSELHEIGVDTQTQTTPLTLPFITTAAPVYAQETSCVVLAGQGLHQYDPTAQDVTTLYEDGTFMTPVYHDEELYGINKHGTVVSTQPTDITLDSALIETSPVYADGRLYVGDTQSQLHILRADSSDVMTISLPSKRGISAPVAVVDDRVIVPTNSGSVFLLES
jgi:outer membrane protein assembly factor BamB